MSWPNPPYPFANATSPEAMAFLDQMFDQVGAMIQIPCTAAGTNAISLTPNVNCPALTAYKELGGYRFAAAANSTAAVTAQYNGLGFLPVYHGDGITQASTGDLIAGQQYIVIFHQALNGGLGGFFLESPSVPNAASTWFSPGGRLTAATNSPVLFSNVSGTQQIFYPAYVHPFVPIYNGSTVQMYQFTSSLSNNAGISLNMGGAANFPINTNFDIFVSLLGGGSPVLCAVAWTNTTTRAVTLSAFAGFLTNSGTTTVQTGPNTSATMPINQGTFLGSVFLPAQGQTNWTFGGASSGGTASQFFICNYYNKVLFTSTVSDNGAAYTYTSSTIRQARASGNNAHSFIQSDSERAISAFYITVSRVAAVLGATTIVGMGVNSISAFNVFHTFSDVAAQTPSTSQQPPLAFSITGLCNLNALEQGDSANANTFNFTGSNALYISLWL